MTRFTCVSIGFGNPRTVERNADTAAKAADAHASALHTAYWAEPYRGGMDGHGSYQEFMIKASASKIHSMVRVYGSYKW